MQTITLNSPLDMHLHLRDGEMLKLVAQYSTKPFSGAIVMPNITPLVDNAEVLNSYRQRILDAANDLNFEPYMTLFMKPYSKEFLETMSDKIKAVKLYPAGVTTNSENGVKSIEAIYPTLEIMQELGIVLSVHGETHGDVFEREFEFTSVYAMLAKQFPKLKIIYEHISDGRGIKLVDEYENIYATISLHHMLLTRDDLMGEKFNPHLFCKPVIKTKQDADEIKKYALNAHPKVCFGSDSAPHPRAAKESGLAPAGIFTAPLILPALCELFEQNDKLENLQKFVCDNARNIYNVIPPQKSVLLVKKDMTVPETIKSEEAETVPMMAGKNISWSIESVS